MLYLQLHSYLTGPSALTVNIMKNIESSSIVVQWDAVDATTYTVIWTDDRDLHGVATVDEQTSYTITGLTLDTVYTITVTAFNRCGDGPEFRTSIAFSIDATSTTSTAMTTTANPSSTSNPSTTNMTTNSITNTVNGNADISSSRNLDSTMSMTTTVTIPSIHITTNMIVTSTNIANTSITDKISKFLIYIHMYVACTTYMTKLFL